MSESSSLESSRVRGRPIVVVVGASRGIGRGLAIHLAAQGAVVVAACRTEATARDLGELFQDSGGCGLVLDVTDPASVRSCKAQVEETYGAINYLVYVAGATFDRLAEPESSKGPLDQLDILSVTEVFNVNCFGAIRVAQEFLPLIAGDHEAAMFMSSNRGSLALTESGSSMSYGMSKAALNMLVRKLALGAGRHKAPIFAVHPGWVATNLGGHEAPTPVHVAAGQLADLLFSATAELNGRFVGVDGIDVPW